MTKRTKTKNINRNPFYTFLFTYNTDRSASIKSVRVGICYRLSQLAIFAYIVGYELYYSKGYQSTEEVSSVITTKVKGQGYVPIKNQSNYLDSFDENDPMYYEKLFTINPGLTYRIFDTADYVIPPNEYNSIFIMSSFVETEQIQILHKGVFNNLSCYTWSPSEGNNANVVKNVLSFTIFIKNDIEFKKFNIKQRNILKQMDNRYLSNCTFNEEKDPFCPIFELGYILEKVEPDRNEKFEMLLKGAVIQIEILWNCNLDFEEICFPKYSFKRFDLKFKEHNASSGFNFRFSNRFRVNNTDYRVLYKAFGLRFIISVTGTAGRFDIVPLMLKIGAGLGLMSLSVIIADCVMLNFTPSKKREFFKRMKRLDLKNSNQSLKEIAIKNNRI